MNIAYVEALQNQFLYLTIAMNLSAVQLQEKNVLLNSEQEVIFLIAVKISLA